MSALSRGKSQMTNYPASDPQAPFYPPEVLGYWNNRLCFICERYGSCGHREFEVAMAVLESHGARRVFQETRMDGLRRSGKQGFQVKKEI